MGLGLPQWRVPLPILHEPGKVDFQRGGEGNYVFVYMISVALCRGGGEEGGEGRGGEFS